MNHPSLLLALTLSLAPTAAVADCATDLAKLNLPTNTETNNDTPKVSPRGKLLITQANKAIANKDEKSCADMVKGLKVVMGISG